jgi:hypothetical protein
MPDQLPDPCTVMEGAVERGSWGDAELIGILPVTKTEDLVGLYGEAGLQIFPARQASSIYLLLGNAIGVVADFAGQWLAVALLRTQVVIVAVEHRHDTSMYAVQEAY